MDKRLLAIIFGASLAVSAFGAGSPYATSFDAGVTSHGISNALIRTPPNVRGTHESSLIWNGTNTISSGGKHIAVVAGSAVMTSSDGAFTGMLPGENIEFPDAAPRQMVIAQVINANNALGYQVNANGFVIATASQASRSDWLCRPRPVRWTDDVVSLEERGGFFDCNGALWIYGIGDQAEVNFLSSSMDGSLFTMSMQLGSSFAYSSQCAWTLSSTITNAFAVNQFAPANIIAVSGWAPSESFDMTDNGVAHFQFGVGGWHGNPLHVNELIQATNGVASQISNKLSLVVIGTSIAATNGGFNWTNTSGRNITVFVDNAGVTASTFKINGTTVYSSALGDFSAPLQDQEWISYLYSVGTPTLKYKPF